MEKSNILAILVGVTLVLSLANPVTTFGINAKLNEVTGNTVLPVDIGNQIGGTGQQVVVQASADDDPVLGSNNAKVTIIEFSDFECPFCQRFHNDAFQEIKTKYIDTGKVKFVYRDFPLSFHPNAQKAAEASECADEQGKYWEYYNKLFENQDALTVSDLKTYAKDLKLDSSKFDQCLDSGKMKAEVDKDAKEAASYGVSGTPTFYINGIELVGAQPFSAFEEVIEQELKK